VFFLRYIWRFDLGITVCAKKLTLAMCWIVCHSLCLPIGERE